MNYWLIFLWIQIAFIAMGFWESSVEGRNAWDKKKLGWKIRLGKSISLTRYHFFLFWVMVPVFLILPFIIYGWDFKLFGVIISSYFFGVVLEDLSWFATNPVVKIKEFNSKFVDYYPWLKIGRFEFPVYYIFDLAVAFLSWYFIWK